MAASRLLIFAVVTLGRLSLVTCEIMDLPAANDFVLIWLPQHDISRKMLVCVMWVFFRPTVCAAPIRTLLNTEPK